MGSPKSPPVLLPVVCGRSVKWQHRHLSKPGFFTHKAESIVTLSQGCLSSGEFNSGAWQVLSKHLYIRTNFVNQLG